MGGVKGEDQVDWGEELLRPAFQPSDPEAALCRQGDPDAWYSGDEVSNSSAARRVCQQCDMRIECLVWAVLNGEQWGIWGGMGLKPRLAWAASRRRRGLPITVEAVYAEDDASPSAA